jgi:hypothetical protein
MIKLIRVPSKGEGITIIYADGGEVEVENSAAAAHELGIEQGYIDANLVDDPNVPDIQILEIEDAGEDGEDDNSEDETEEGEEGEDEETK